MTIARAAPGRRAATEVPLDLPAITRPDSPEAWLVAGELVDEYVRSLPMSLDFQDYEHERARLAEHYGPPRGVFLLAMDGSAASGCGAVRPFSDVTCEMKRLYVRPEGQGRGVGRALALALIAEARRIGYRRMRLDTLPSMATAQRLYRSLGFAPVPPYRLNPVEGAVFLELVL